MFKKVLKFSAKMWHFLTKNVPFLDKNVTVKRHLMRLTFCAPGRFCDCLFWQNSFSKKWIFSKRQIIKYRPWYLKFSIRGKSRSPLIEILNNYLRDPDLRSGSRRIAKRDPQIMGWRFAIHEIRDLRSRPFFT